MMTDNNTNTGADTMTMTTEDLYTNTLNTLKAMAKRFTWKSSDPRWANTWTEELAVTDAARGRMIWAVRGDDLSPVAWIDNDGTVFVNGQTTYLKPLLRGRKVRKGTGMGYLAEHRNPRTGRMVNPNGRTVESASPHTMVVWAGGWRPGRA